MLCRGRDCTRESNAYHKTYPPGECDGGYTAATAPTRRCIDGQLALGFNHTPHSLRTTHVLYHQLAEIEKTRCKETENQKIFIKLTLLSINDYFKPAGLQMTIFYTPTIIINLVIDFQNQNEWVCLVSDIVSKQNIPAYYDFEV